MTAIKERHTDGRLGVPTSFRFEPEVIDILKAVRAKTGLTHTEFVSEAVLSYAAEFIRKYGRLRVSAKAVLDEIEHDDLANKTLEKYGDKPSAKGNKKR